MPMTAFLIKLNGLETDRLRSIQAHIDTLLAARLDTSIRPGREAWFISKRGERMDVTIDRLNITTVSVTVIGTGARWKVGKSMLHVVPIERKVAKPVAPLIARTARPATIGDGSW